MTITGRSHSAGLLLNATTGLSSLSLDIAEASIHTESDGTVRDEFVVRKSGRRTGKAAQLTKDDFEEVEVRKKRTRKEEIRDVVDTSTTHPRSTSTHTPDLLHTLTHSSTTPSYPGGGAECHRGIEQEP